MTTNKQVARIAGLLYLVVVLTGLFSLAYVPSKLVVWDNPHLTLEQITAGEQLFRLGIVSSLTCYIFFIFLPLVLYRLLSPVHGNYARLMAVLAIVSVPISFVNIQHKFAILSLIGNSGYLRSSSPEQLQALVMYHLDQYDSGILIVSLFWGLWLFPFGYLVFRSGILPKILGVLLMLGCIGYLLNFLGNVLLPAYPGWGISAYVRMPATLGEIGTCLWLLVIGARNKDPHKLQG